MEYPFEFRELLLSEGVVQTLGFKEYQDGAGNYGSRSLSFSNGKWYTLYQNDEMEESDYTGMYDTPCYYVSGNFAKSHFQPMYFLHELYEDIKATKSQEEVDLFIELTKKKGVNMWYYLESYLEYIKDKA